MSEREFLVKYKKKKKLVGASRRSRLVEGRRRDRLNAEYRELRARKLEELHSQLGVVDKFEYDDLRHEMKLYLSRWRTRRGLPGRKYGGRNRSLAAKEAARVRKKENAGRQRTQFREGHENLFNGRAPRSSDWLPYEMFCGVLRRVGLTSMKQYKLWRKEMHIRWAPYRPEEVYGDYWEGWPVVLGTNNKMENDVIDRSQYLPFWVAAKMVHRLKIGSYVAWKEYCKDNELPKGVPHNPMLIYDEWGQGGIGWNQWLGKDVNSVLKSSEVVEDSRVWCYVMGGDLPNGVVRLLDGLPSQCLDYVERGRYQVVRTFKSEDDYKDVMWEILNRMSSAYMGQQVDRLCSNVHMMMGELQMELLVVNLKK